MRRAPPGTWPASPISIYGKLVDPRKFAVGAAVAVHPAPAAVQYVAVIGNVPLAARGVQTPAEVQVCPNPPVYDAVPGVSTTSAGAVDTPAGSG